MFFLLLSVYHFLAMGGGGGDTLQVLYVSMLQLRVEALQKCQHDVFMFFMPTNILPCEK